MPNLTRWYPTEAQLKKLLELWTAGVPKLKIGAVLGVSEPIVTRWLDEHYGVVTPRGCTKFSKTEVHKRGGVYFDISKFLEGGDPDG